MTKHTLDNLIEKLSGKLKPCACGCIPVIFREIDYKSLSVMYQVQCKCGVTGADFHSPEEAVDYWIRSQIHPMQGRIGKGE